MGLIFCRVIKIHTLVHDKLRTIFGYQQKAGGPPAFVKIAIWNNGSDHNLMDVVANNILAIIRPDDIAWMAKYNGAQEISFLLFAFPKIGRKANIFSSKPIHIINHWLDEIETIILNIIVEIRSVWVGSHIKTRNELNVSKED